MFGSAYKSTISQLDLPGSNISRVLAITIKKKIKKAFLLHKHKYRCVLFRGPDVGRKIPTGQKFSSSVEKDPALRAE